MARNRDKLRSAGMLLACILAWHVCVIFVHSWLQARVLDALHMGALRFWYQQGCSAVLPTPFQYQGYSQAGINLQRAWGAASHCLAVMLFEGVLAWAGFRVILRRMRMRVRRLLRFWWLACMYATAIFFVLIFADVATSGLMLFPYVGVTGFWLVLFWAVFFFVTPAGLARREIRRRASRLMARCPNCGYCLLGSPQALVCSECGSHLLKSGRGGFLLDRSPEGRVQPASRLRRWATVLTIVMILALFTGTCRQLANMGRLLGPAPGPLATCIQLRTAAGPVLYARCLLCESTRIESSSGEVEYPVKGAQFAVCNHMWQGALDAWSRQRLQQGDVLLIRKGGLYSAVRILATPPQANTVDFEWFHQPDPSKGTFSDPPVQYGVVTAAAAITFKDIFIQYQSGAVWYDFYYGGVDGATRFASDPHEIAFAGPLDPLTVDASSAQWRYKTSEDGR